MDKNAHFSLLIAGINWPLETFLQRLVRGLAEAGLDITLATPRPPDEDWLANPRIHWLKAPQWHGSSPSSLGFLAWHGLRAFLAAPNDVKIVAGHIRSQNAARRKLIAWQRCLPYLGRRWDAIYFPWNSGAIEHLPLFDLGMPVVVSCRGSQVNTAPHNPIRTGLQDGLWLTFEKASRVHCVSEHIQKEAFQFGLTSEKTCLIHPAVDTEEFYPIEVYKPADGIYRIISVGTLTWIKGYEYALIAAHLLKEKGVPFKYEILGDGPERQRVLYTIADLGLQEQVHLLGRQPPEVVRQRLQQADVFLLSSLSEGFCNAALEAMACALPVVTTDCGGIREAVTDGMEGYLVPIRNPTALAGALQALWANPQLRKQYGEAGRKRVVADFNLKRQVEQFSTLFTRLASHSQGT